VIAPASGPALTRSDGPTRGVLGAYHTGHVLCGGDIEVGIVDEDREVEGVDIVLERRLIYLLSEERVVGILELGIESLLDGGLYLCLHVGIIGQHVVHGSGKLIGGGAQLGGHGKARYCRGRECLHHCANVGHGGGVGLQFGDGSLKLGIVGEHLSVILGNGCLDVGIGHMSLELGARTHVASGLGSGNQRVVGVAELTVVLQRERAVDEACGSGLVHRRSGIGLAVDLVHSSLKGIEVGAGITLAGVGGKGILGSGQRILELGGLLNAHNVGKILHFYITQEGLYPCTLIAIGIGSRSPTELVVARCDRLQTLFDGHRTRDGILGTIHIGFGGIDTGQHHVVIGTDKLKLHVGSALPCGDVVHQLVLLARLQGELVTVGLAIDHTATVVGSCRAEIDGAGKVAAVGKLKRTRSASGIGALRHDIGCVVDGPTLRHEALAKRSDGLRDAVFHHKVGGIVGIGIDLTEAQLECG